MDTPLNPLTAVANEPPLANWEEFRANLESAVDASLPTKAKPYNHVSVLIVVWEASSEEFKKEALDMKRFFEGDFGYEIELWEIPIKRTATASGEKLVAWAKAHGTPENLCIFVYNGHGRASKQEKSIWVPGSGIKAELRWTLLEPMLTDYFESDVLCVIDSCFAATAGVSARVEIIAASGIADKAQGPGEMSFTAFMIKAMKSFSQPFNVAMLHSRMVAREFRVYGGRTPICIARQDRVKPSIFLCRLPPPTLASIGRPEEEFLRVPEPRVLIKLSLDINAAIPEIQQWINYLTINMPSHIKQGEVNIEGVYRSSSTAVLLTCPVWVWSCLEAKEGMQFVAFVDSGNLLSQLRRRGQSSSEETYVESLPPTGPPKLLG